MLRGGSWNVLAVIIAFSLCVDGAAPLWAQEAKLSRKERQLIRSVEEDLERASRFFTNGKFEECATAYKAAVEQLSQLTEESSPALLKEFQPIHAKLVKAQELLREKGQEVPPPAPLPRGKNAEISFANEVAPLLVAKCGGCHVNNQRGQFGMATYKALMASGQVVANDPVESRLIQVIDSGEMPKGGDKVTEAELNLLRAWVSAGAKADAEEEANLRTLGPKAAEAPAEERPQLVKATGKETVSFARDIAPILIENCSGCHVDVRQPRAGLNLGVFAALLRGGDSGAILKSSKSADSLIVKKLLGTGGGNRMPVGRPPLPQEKIDLIAKWIDEGATFDGGDANQPIRTVAARTRAAGLGHAELSRERLAAASKTWKTFNPGRKFEVIEFEDFNLLAEAPKDSLQKTSERIEKVVAGLKQAAKLKGSEPLVKGKVSILIVTQRYDLNEYGNMVLKHEFPPTLNSHWQFNQVDAHIVMLLKPDQTEGLFEPELARNLAAISQASQTADAPRWFAAGMGYSIAAKMYSRSDEVAAWEDAAASAAKRMAQPTDFLAGKLPEDQAALVAYAFVEKLRANGPKFKKFTQSLEQGEAFAAAFQQAFGQPPEELLQSPPAGGR